MAGATKAEKKVLHEVVNARRVCRNPGCPDPIGQALAGDTKPLVESLRSKTKKKKGRGTRDEGRGNGGTGKASGTRRKKGRGERGEGRGKAEGNGPAVHKRQWDLNWPVEQIDRSPFQPRQDFPAAELRAFADEIGRDGLLHPLSVRPGGSFSLLGGDPLKCRRYELVDGERRLRAIRLLGWTQVPVRMAVYTDAEARALILASALQRKELNAIEEAAAFRAAIDAGDAPGPTELARQLGLSQGHVSNRLRLLELPEKVRAKVISREISATNARALVPLKEAQPVLDAVLQEVGDVEGQEMGAVAFLDAINDAINNTCQRIETSPTRDYKHQCNIPPLKFTDEQRSALGIIEHTPPWRGSKPQQYATNTDLYEKLHAEHVKAVIERAEKRAGKEGGGERGEGREKNGKPLSAAGKKRWDREEAERDKERAEKRARGVWAVAIDRRRRLVAEACRERQVSPEDTLRLLLYFSAARTRSNERAGESHCHATAKRDGREEILGKQLKARYRGDAYDLPAAIRGLEDRDVCERALDFVAEMFCRGDDFSGQVIPDEDVQAIANQLAIDLAAAWKKDALGPLTERWLNLRSKEAIGELAKGWGLKIGGGKAEMVAALAKKANRQKPPAELVKPKRPRN